MNDLFRPNRNDAIDRKQLDGPTFHREIEKSSQSDHDANAVYVSPELAALIGAGGGNIVTAKIRDASAWPSN